MRLLSRFAAVAAVLFLPAVALHASPADAAAVLGHCGAPLSDGMTALEATDGQQRMMQYPAARLYFEHDGDGWSFLFANQGHNTNLNRVQTSALMPCFLKARRSVAEFGVHVATLRAAQAAKAMLPVPVVPPAPVLTQRQRLVAGLREVRMRVWIGVTMLYLLPVMVGRVRRAERMRYLILVDMFSGWTVVGWLYAMLIAVADRTEPPDEEIAEERPMHSGVIQLNSVESAPLRAKAS